MSAGCAIWSRTMLPALLISPQTWLLWLAVIREAVQLARLLGPEKARDTIRRECSNCIANQGGN